MFICIPMHFFLSENINREDVCDVILDKDSAAQFEFAVDNQVDVCHVFDICKGMYMFMLIYIYMYLIIR
jgi:hypothetical protein